MRPAAVLLAERDPVLTTEVPGKPDDRTVERWVERRITVIWALLFFNGLGSARGRSLIPIPRGIAQMLTFLALGVALMLALGVNRRLMVRPNTVLGLSTVLVALALMTSVRLQAGPGSLVRSGRFACFVAVLWLLTPWWGRRDMLLVRCHLRALLWVSVTVLIGLVLSPSGALSGGVDGRLVGLLWRIPPPQVAEYAAVASGLAIVLWLAGSLSRGPALLIGGGGIAMVLLSQTRTAMLGWVAGVICATLTLLLARRRVRRVLTVMIVATPFLFVAVAPAASTWFTRNQSTERISGLTGRKQVWDGLLAERRPEFNRWFGRGLSDKSFNGLSIDSTWLAVYRDEGLVGDFLVGSILLFLLVASAFRPPGPARALATFIVVYSIIASYTEVGLGDASPYLLSIVVAASLLLPEARGEPMLVEHGH
ncbi:MAG: hypothetical protein QOG43_2210 [Actinomycetota bacterium]|jgi:hypothetical protein|nr:hypothetical protein [Actinomycetota bacterium]